MNAPTIWETRRHRVVTRKGGWRIGEAELLERRIEGGPLAAAQAAARLLKITFTVPGEDEGNAA